MQTTMSQYVAVATLVLTPLGSWAQEVPGLGIVYHMTERSSLTYSCKKTNPEQLSCEFVQSSIRPKATIQELPAFIENSRKQFVAQKTPGDECKTFRDMVDVLEGTKPAPDPKGLASMTPVQKADGLSLGKAGLAYCAKPNVENVDAMARLMHERDRRTCTVSTNAFKQTFRKADAGADSAWIVQDKPSGPCGVVQLSRFEPEKGSTGYKFWKYIARKAITNPSGELMLGGKCTGLDEAPYIYHWHAKEHQLSCDYFQFSPL